MFIYLAALCLSCLTWAWLLCSMWGLSSPTRDGAVSPPCKADSQPLSTREMPGVCFHGQSGSASVVTSSPPPPPAPLILCPSNSPNVRVRASLPDLRSPTGPGNVTGVLKNCGFFFSFCFSVPALRRSCRLRGRSEPSCETALLGQKARPQPRPGAFSTRGVDSAGSGRAQGRACG